MVKKKKLAKKTEKKKIKVVRKIKIGPGQKEVKISKKDFPSMNLKSEYDIAMDFATKAYKKFDKTIKSIVLFGSSVKKSSVIGSDIDIIIILDDATILWDDKMKAWYRDELDNIIRTSPYQKSLHINTIKLSTWWEDLIRGDPVIMNILRNSEPLIDIAGFFVPLQYLLVTGKIRPSPEAIYSCLQRAPIHIQRSKVSELNSIEGLYWAMVDSAHAALIAAGNNPPSPEHITEELYKTFVVKEKLEKKYIEWYRDLLILHKDIMHGKIRDLKGVEIDSWQEKTEMFLEKMAKLVKEFVA
jgi:predicted nucleotidyltransferase/uncharacterized protein (UPF0332 family)